MLAGKHIAVLMGGPGSERKVSLASGKAVVEALQQAGAANVIAIDVTTEDIQVPQGIDLAFNVIHGTFGEDGGLQSDLEQKGIPYTGAGVAASRLAFNKIESKDAFTAAGVPTPKHQIIALPATPEDIVLSLPVVIKPPREGSSVGVHIVKEASQVGAALVDVANYDSIALAETFIKGRELTVGIVGDQVLPVVEICPRDGFYDMNNKYPWMGGNGGTDYFCPADLTPEVTAKVQEAALAAHRALGVEVYSRVDVLYSEENGPFVLEVNTIPGMTASSLLPKAAAAAGITFSQLCAMICQLSLDIRK